MMDPGVANSDIDLWFKTTHDCSSAVTGSSVFDFNGDGKAEVIYSDEYHLWMYDGQTGTNLIPSTCNTTGTLWEYPLVADVDNDGYMV
ncbi:FG-GAP repeat domain-containing protein [Nannocystis pusilla]|uniref:FG-GAP repeat domain-containing protein n=1 Tax=Nannocystis pusilla TaxID=889268 RepID=UPI003B789D86